MRVGFKPALFCLILLAIFPLVFGLTVETSVPKQVNYQQEFSVTIKIKAGAEIKFDIAAILPNGWEIIDWTASTNSFFETRNIEYVGKNVSASRWTFENVSDDVIITYKTKAITTGENKITTLWIFPGGFSSEDNTIYVNLVAQTQKANAFVVMMLLITTIVIGGVIYREYIKINNKKRINPKKKIKTKKKRR